MDLDIKQGIVKTGTTILGLKCKDGAYRWFRARAETERDAQGRPLHSVGGISSIDDEKRREAELEVTLTRFALSREMLSDGIWALAVVAGDPVNPDNAFWWSPQLRRLLGFETEAEFPNVLKSWAWRRFSSSIELMPPAECSARPCASRSVSARARNQR